MVINKAAGAIKGSYYTQAFFTFHHINAFEKGQDIFVDIAAYSDDAIIEELRLGRLTASDEHVLPFYEVRRYRLSGTGTQADYETLSEHSLELPRIKYWNRHTNQTPAAFLIETRYFPQDRLQVDIIFPVNSPVFFNISFNCRQFFGSQGIIPLLTAR